MDFHLPQPIISSELVSSGCLASAAGMPAQKECLENFLLSSPSLGSSRLRRVLLSERSVSPTPELKLKTRESLSLFEDSLSLPKAFTGHTPWPGKLNMYIYKFPACCLSFTIFYVNQYMVFTNKFNILPEKGIFWAKGIFVCR